MKYESAAPRSPYPLLPQPQAYRDILDGRWEEWDPFKVGPRIQAVEFPGFGAGGSDGDGAVAGGPSGSGAGYVPPQAFRPFQGYLSFGRWGELGNVSVFVVCWSVGFILGIFVCLIGLKEDVDLK